MARIDRTVVFKALFLLVAGAILAVWLVKTPPGLLGKADAIGYAICHRISARSFFLADRQMPLCARCSGMYLGALLGMLLQARLGRRGGFPSLRAYIVLGFFFVIFAVDGVNSYFHLFPNAPGIYTPQNWLRLLTGTGLGLGLAAVLLPAFHQTLWQRWDERPSLDSWRQILLWLGLAALLNGLTLSENPLVLYPLAVLSTATVWVILGFVYTMIWVMLTHRENSFTTWRQAWFVLLAGFTTALVQLAVMDLGRYWLTGTWNGFSF